MRHPGLFALALGGAIFVVGCSDAQWQSLNGARSDDEELEVVAELPEDQASVPAPEVALPANFPTDIPLYPNARITEADEEINGYHVVLETTDDPWRVLAYYHSRLREFGWGVDHGSSNALMERTADTFGGTPRLPEAVCAMKESRLLMLVYRNHYGQTRWMMSISDMDARDG